MAKSAKKKKKVQQPVVYKSTANASVETTPEPSQPTKRVHPLVVAFVAFHVVAVTLYSLPQPSEAILSGSISPRGTDAFLKFNQEEFKQWAPFYGYAYITGFWQYWDMFAPDPAQTDFWCDAEVTYLDGTKKIFQYPRIHDLSIPRKFIYERHRKYFERVNQDTKYSFLLPSFGQYIAYQMATDPNNPPVKVGINRHFQEWQGHHMNPNGPEPPYGSYQFFVHVVDLTKLYADKGWKLGIH